MPDSTPLSDLVALHEQLSRSMHEASALIEELDAGLAAAAATWTSKAAHEFSDSWHNGFKPSLAKLCQSLAAAGTDVAFQHNHAAWADAEASPEGDAEAGSHPELEPLQSPQ